MEELIEKIEEKFGKHIISITEKEMPVLVVQKESFYNLIQYLKNRENFLILLDITAVDYLKWLKKKEKRFEVVYHLYSIEYNTRLRIKYTLDEKEKALSLTSLYKNANWLEREVYDMYGIKFKDHPDMRRILMYDEFEGHPLRKDYDLKKRQQRFKTREEDD